MGEYIDPREREVKIDPVAVAAGAMVRFQLVAGHQSPEAAIAQVEKDAAYAALPTGGDQAKATWLAQETVKLIRDKEKKEAQRRSEELQKERIKKQDETLREGE